MKTLKKAFTYLTLLIFLNFAWENVKIYSDTFASRISQTEQKLVLESAHNLPFYIFNADDDESKKVFKQNKKLNSFTFAFFAASFCSLNLLQKSTLFKNKKYAIHFASKYHKILKSKQTIF